MITRELSWAERLRVTRKYLRLRLTGKPLLVNFEVTKFCNARCDYCDCWKTTFTKPLVDYDEVVKVLDPLVVVITGGEPLLRKDLPDLIRKIKASTDFVYLSLITNGSLLTEAKALEFREAGLDQLAVSLNYLDRRQDDERQLEGLYEHIAGLVPRLTAQGMVVSIHTVIMRGNLDQLVPLAHQTKAWNALISYSAYTDFKNGNKAHLLGPDGLARLGPILTEMLRLKRTLGHIANSRFYLENVMNYFANGGIGGCQAGRKFVQLTSTGMVQQCADFDPYTHFSDWKPLSANGCKACWYTCRGETEASLGLERLLELTFDR